MPVAFLYNRKLQGANDRSLSDALSGCNYQIVSQCYQLYILERDVDVCEELRGDSHVGIIAAEVEGTMDSVSSVFPWSVPDMPAIVTVVTDAQLPALEGLVNVVTIPWGDAKRSVLESLLQCAQLHGSVGSRTTKRHAGVAQGILKREISGLSSSALSHASLGLFVEPPVQRVCEFLETVEEGEAWPDVASWLVDSFAETRHLYSVAPGWSECFPHFLPVLRRELKAHALKRMKGSRIDYVRSGKLLSPCAEGITSCVVLSVDRAGLPDYANPKHCLTLVCSLEALHRQLSSVDNFDLESISSLHLVCGQSPDMRRLRLRPPVLLDGNTYVLVIVLERMHEVVFA